MKLDKRQMKKKVADLWSSGHRPLDSDSVKIVQIFHPKKGWLCIDPKCEVREINNNFHGHDPRRRKGTIPFTLESLARLEAQGHTVVGIEALDVDGYYIARCADFHMVEFKVEGEPTWAELKAGRLTLPCSRCCSLPCIHYDDEPHVETAGQCKKCYPCLDDAILIVTGFYYNGKGLCDGHAEVVYDNYYGNLEAKGIERMPCRMIKKEVTA